MKQAPFERLVGVLLLAGLLGQRMAEPTDRQVAQLLLDYCGNDVGMLLPETVIHRHATRRLLRSAGGRITAKELKEQRPGATCPRCGSEMLPHVGIDEPDFSQCVLVECGYKQHTSREPHAD